MKSPTKPAKPATKPAPKPVSKAKAHAPVMAGKPIRK
jgi:hypothetical protein